MIRETFIEFDDYDLAVTVHFEAVPFERGSTDGPGGPKLEPDIPAHIEIDWVKINGGPDDGKDVEMTPKQEAILRDMLADMLSEEEDAAREREY